MLHDLAHCENAAPRRRGWEGIRRGRRQAANPREVTREQAGVATSYVSLPTPLFSSASLKRW